MFRRNRQPDNGDLTGLINSVLGQLRTLPHDNLVVGIEEDRALVYRPRCPFCDAEDPPRFGDGRVFCTVCRRVIGKVTGLREQEILTVAHEVAAWGIYRVTK